jgi:iron complex outermembrane recepter protein
MHRILCVVLLFISMNSKAQTNCTYRIEGKVVDALSFDALPFARVELLPAGKTTVCNENGEFVFYDLCAGKMTLKTYYIGFDSLQQSLVLEKNSDIRLKLIPSTKELKQTEIVAEHIEGKSIQLKDSVTEMEMRKSAGLGLTSYLKSITGVTTMSTGSSIVKPVIHGMHSQRVIIMNAGIRQEGQQWGTEHAPEIDPYVANKLQVIKGVSSIQYGTDAIAGVILVEPRKLRHEPGMNAELNLVGFSNGRQQVVSGLVEQHLGKFYDICWRLQGTLKRSGNINTPDVYLENTGFTEANWSASLGVERNRFGVETFFSQFKTTLGIFRGAHIGNLSDLTRIIVSGEVITDNRFTYNISNPRQEILHYLFSTKAWWTITNVGKLNLLYGYQYNQRQEFDRFKPLDDSLAALNRPAMELRLYTHTVDLHLETRNVKGFTSTIGLSGMIQDNQYGGLRFFVPNYQLANGGAYGIVRWRKNRVEAESGIRYDRKTQTVFRNVNNTVVQNDYTFNTLGISGGALFKMDSVFSWRLNAGRTERTPSINEWFSDGLHHGAASIEVGDSTLGLERAWNINAVMNVQTNKLAMELNVFYMFIQDYIYLVPTSKTELTVNGAFPTFAYSHVDASFKGVDCSFNWQLTPRLNFISKNSLVFAWNLTADRYLELIPPPQFDQQLSYKFKDNEHRKDQSVGISVMHVMEQKRFAAGSDFIPPPRAYTLLGLEAAATFVLKNQSFILGFSVSNLLNTRYRDYLNRFRYYTDEMGRNISVKLKIPLSFKTAEHAHEH